MKKIILVANTSWYIYNFRKLLLKEIRKRDYRLIIVTPYSSKYTQKLLDEGFIVINWNLVRNSINPFSSLLSIFHLYKIYKEEKPNIINHFTIKPCIYGTIASRFIKVNKCINSITGIGSWYENENVLIKLIIKIIDPILKFIFTRKNIIFIFQNKSDKDIFIKKKYALKSRCHLIEGSGVDSDFFKPKNELKDKSKIIKILFPARLIREKGIMELIEASERLWKDNKKFYLLIAGETDEGNNSSLTQKEKIRIRKNKNIKFLGHLEDMRLAYESCDLVVLPSWREGLSRSLIEASSMECPIITTDVPGCVEIVENGINGLIVKSKNVYELEKAIRFALKDIQSFRELGKNGREKVITKFDARIINRNNLNVYEYN